MGLVVDASYTVAIALEEGDVADVDRVEAIMAEDGATVPPLWRWEVANAILLAMRRKRIVASRARQIFAELESFPISEDAPAAGRASGATYAIAERHALTVYDASYLELASRLGASLATNDRKLAAAARSEGLTVFGSPAR